MFLVQQGAAEGFAVLVPLLQYMYAIACNETRFPEKGLRTNTLKPLCILILFGVVTNDLMGQLSFRISTDKNTYRYDEPILVTIAARNLTNTPDTLRFSSGCQADYHIDTLDYLHHDSITIQCTQGFTERIVPGNDSVAWESSYWSYSFTGARVGSGKHAVTAWVDYLPSGWRSDTLWIFVTTPTIVEHNILTPEMFRLENNFPNPFNPETKITFSIPEESFVTITMFDVLGRHVGTLVQDRKQPGEYSVSWNAGSQSGGVYFCHLVANAFSPGHTGTISKIKKLMLVR